MENNQSTQHSSELDYSKLARSSRSTLSNNLKSLLTLLKHWPWLIWGGVGVLLFAISAIAILSLTYPLSLEQEEPTKPILAGEPTETSFRRASYVPLWVVGTAALTFAAGSLVIFKLLNSSSRSSKLRERYSRRSLTRRQQRKVLLQGHSSVPTQPEPSPLPTMPVEMVPVVMLPSQESYSLTLAEESLAILGDHSPCSNAESEPVVTVLPPEENHLVDLEESLAEIMDIRKHRSLSSILQDSEGTRG